MFIGYDEGLCQVKPPTKSVKRDSLEQNYLYCSNNKAKSGSLFFYKLKMVLSPLLKNNNKKRKQKQKYGELHFGSAVTYPV